MKKNKSYQGMFKKHRQDCEHPYSQVTFLSLDLFLLFIGKVRYFFKIKQ